MTGSANPTKAPARIIACRAWHSGEFDIEKPSPPELTASDELHAGRQLLTISDG